MSCDLFKMLLRNSSLVFASGLDHVVPKTQKLALDTSLFNAQQYKVGFMGKVEQSRERDSVLPNISV